jgi:hypothetical protein
MVFVSVAGKLHALRYCVMRSAIGKNIGIINDSDDWPDSSRALLFGTGTDEGHRASGDDCMGLGMKCSDTVILRRPF